MMYTAKDSWAALYPYTVEGILGRNVVSSGTAMKTHINENADNCVNSANCWALCL